MMTVMILIISVAGFLQFFVPYCRSLLSASARQPLSADVQEITGISNPAAAEDFARVLQLLRLCPDRSEDRRQVRAVHVYFDLLTFLRGTIAKIIPTVLSHIERERGQCTYFAAVMLDRRIAFSKDMLAAQMEN